VAAAAARIMYSAQAMLVYLLAFRWRRATLFAEKQVRDRWLRCHWGRFSGREPINKHNTRVKCGAGDNVHQGFLNSLQEIQKLLF